MLGLMTFGYLLVAPHAGAWIETRNSSCSIVRAIVAPHAGAWIETRVGSPLMRQVAVAPHAGAWIETCF